MNPPTPAHRFRPRRLGSSLLPALLAALLLAGASSNSPSRGADLNGVVLVRAYDFVLKPGNQMGRVHPPLDRFVPAGRIPGGQNGKGQLLALAQRFTLKDLGFFFSDAAPVGIGRDAVLKLGSGDVFRVEVHGLGREESGKLSSEFVFYFNQREVLRHRETFQSGDALLFAGRLDPQWPLLNVFSLETRIFPPGQPRARDEFLAQAERDRQVFAPPPPVQRTEEPYLPGVGDVTMPDLISSAKAVYPEEARPERKDGQVIVEIVVDHEGRATRPRIIDSSDPVFNAVALESAKTYRYRPATKGGKPVSVVMNLIMMFRFTARANP